jgi:hypothetical protein
VTKKLKQAINVTKPTSHVDLCDELMGTSPSEQLKIRCIYLTDSMVFFGIVLRETEDSFLVGAGVKMVMTETRTLTYQPISPKSIVRLMKSSVAMMTKTSRLYGYHYDKYLALNGNKLLPDVITKELVASIEASNEDYETKNILNNAEPPAKQEGKETLSKSYDKQGIKGVSEHAFLAHTKSGSIH